jgi:superoxide dismutase, Cu-Zn family
MKWLISPVGTVAGLLLILGAPAGAAEGSGEQVKKGVAVLSPTKGNSAQGTVTFTPRDGQVLVRVEMSGLTPGKRGIHVHEFGDCSAPDGTSAGDHYNPTDKEHGGPKDEERHVGDFGNITADENGSVSTEFLDPVITLEGPHSIVGRAVVVHGEEDDLTSQPSGDAGGRVACGVIGIAKP